MGLDSVELIMEVESVFEVEIPDADAARIRTVGELYDYLCVHSPLLRGHRAPGVYSGPFWNRFADVVAEEIGVELAAV